MSAEQADDEYSLRRTLVRIVAASHTKSAVDRIDAVLTVVTAHSLVVTAAVRLVRGSRLYQWLETPPDQERTVVNIRDSVLLEPLVRALFAALAGIRLAWQHAMVVPFLANLRWKLRNRPGRVLGGLLAVWVFVEYGRFFYPGVESAFGPLGRGTLIAFSIFFLRIRLPPGTISRSRTARILGAILLPPKGDD